jgi:hypothetical protein
MHFAKQDGIYFINLKKNVMGFFERNMQVRKNEHSQKKQDRKTMKKIELINEKEMKKQKNEKKLC